MISVYYTLKAESSRSFLRSVLSNVCGISQIKLAETEHGKPYLVDHPLKFNLSHSGKLTALALSEEEVGLDVQLREAKQYAALRRRMTPAERQEDFYKLWTAKEAYVKLCGGSLAAMLSSLEYRGGTLFEHQNPVKAALFHTQVAEYTVCVCSPARQEVTFREYNS